jgi:hypothetical protein
MFCLVCPHALIDTSMGRPTIAGQPHGRMFKKLELAVSLEFTCAFYKFIRFEKRESFRYREPG